jgi:hypothetical protein
MTQLITWSGGIWLSRSGNIGASPMLLLVTSTACISSVCSSIPMYILRQRRRLGPPTVRQSKHSFDERGLAGIPLAFAFALSFDAGTIDKQV